MIIFTLYLSSVSFWSLIFPWPLGFFVPARIQKIYTKKHTHLDVTNCVLFSSLCADQEENEIFLLCPGVSTSKPWRTWRWKMTTAKTYPLFIVVKNDGILPFMQLMCYDISDSSILFCETFLYSFVHIQNLQQWLSWSRPDAPSRRRSLCTVLGSLHCEFVISQKAVPHYVTSSTLFLWYFMHVKETDVEKDVTCLYCALIYSMYIICMYIHHSKFWGSRIFFSLSFK